MSSSSLHARIEDVAIIGMSGRFPGAANVEEYWQKLRHGSESISIFSDEELRAAGVAPDLINNPTYVRARGVLKNIESFDAAFFGLTPREAELTDPQHRLLLECSWEALEGAGYNPESYEGLIGVYAGSSANSYFLNHILMNRDLLSLDALQVALGNEADHLALKVSYKLDLKGPSITIQTSCSTSLVAIHLACQSLINYQCDIALAGGVSINVPQTTGYLYHADSIKSPDGHCRAFDAQASGTVGGNGGGVVVLKRLEEALADGDTIHAVIKGSAVNNDGAAKVSYTAPSLKGQADVIALALAAAEVEADTITYVEAHGTGTIIGDPIEIEALVKAFRSSTHSKGFCAVGSVKTNIGHLDAAAGVAGLIKTVLALKHQQIPPSLHFNRTNPRIDFHNSPFYVNTRLARWERRKGTPRRAGVSSFGIGGTNAHLIIEESPADVPPPVQSTDWHLMVQSARTESALETITAGLVQSLKKSSGLQPGDVAYTLQVGRKGFKYRRMFVCQSLDEFVKALDTPGQERVLTARAGDENRPKVFMFAGQGAQFSGMTRQLYQSEAKFREQVDLCCERLRPHLGFDLRRHLYPEQVSSAEDAQQLDQTMITQPALFVVEYALARLWIEWGIRPDAMIGHSIGEYVAACLAGVLTLEDALSLVAARGRLIQQLPRGAMLAVMLPEDKLTSLLEKDISIAAINGPCDCVVSGTTDAIEKFEQRLKAGGLPCLRLRTSHAFHSGMLEPIISPFRKCLEQVKLNAPEVPYISNVTGTWMTAADATDPDYWIRHLRQMVRFAHGVEELLQKPNWILLEVGPGRTLSRIIKRHPARSAEQMLLNSLPHFDEPLSEKEVLLSSLGKLWLTGARVDWPGFQQGLRRHRLPLPTYPFERQRHWIERVSPGGIPDSHQNFESALKQQCVVAEPELGESLKSDGSTNPAPAPANAIGESDLPQNEVEHALAEMIQQQFGIEQIGRHDNFFDLGGNSVLGIQFMSKLRDTFKVELRLNSLFDSPTVCGMARLIQLEREAGSINTLLDEIENLSAEEIKGLLAEESISSKW